VHYRSDVELFNPFLFVGFAGVIVVVVEIAAVVGSIATRFQLLRGSFVVAVICAATLVVGVIFGCFFPLVNLSLCFL
jgi:hypothetical protein